MPEPADFAPDCETARLICVSRSQDLDVCTPMPGPVAAVGYRCRDREPWTPQDYPPVPQPTPRKRSRLGAALVALTVAGGGAWWLWRSR